jgi:hypothetical protein
MNDDEKLKHALERLYARMDQPEVRAWLLTCKEAGKAIDPRTAEVTWSYAQTLDPYGVCDDIPEECYSVGRQYFARSPGSDIWVSFYDLPEATAEALSVKRKQADNADILPWDETSEVSFNDNQS